MSTLICLDFKRLIISQGFISDLNIKFTVKQKFCLKSKKKKQLIIIKLFFPKKGFEGANEQNLSELSTWQLHRNEAFIFFCHLGLFFFSAEFDLFFF